MKAWSYKNDDDETAIYYAETPGEVKEHVMDEYGLEEADYIDIRVYREKWADKYYCKDIPDKAWIENGYKAECANCGNWTGEDDLGGYIKGKVVCKECLDTRMGFIGESLSKAPEEG